MATTVVRWATQQQRWSSENSLLSVAFALFGGSVLVEMAGLEIGLLRPVIVVPFLSLVPGYLLCRLFGVESEDITGRVLYSLGLSLCFLMVYGVLLNTVLPRVGVEAVFTEPRLFVAMVAGVGGLFWAHLVRNDPGTVDIEAFVDALWHPWPLALLCVPFIAILGARLVTRFGNNGLIIAVLTGMGAVVAAAYLGRLPTRVFALVIWVVAVSLLLHNSVLTHVIAWDAPKELRLATLVVENGVWQADVGGKWMKNAMLRIVILHPIYALLSDISLLWEFKTVSPLLFSFAPVAFYRSYQAVVKRPDALLAALLPMSFFSFFTVLSWNSRTSGALLFLSLVALTLTDRTLSRPKRRILALVFLFGIVVSHYGIAYIVLAAMGLVFVGNWALFGVKQTAKRAHTAPVVVVLFGLTVFLWYVFIVYQAGAFSRLVSFSNEFFVGLWQDLLGTGRVVSAEDSTTTGYVTKRYTSDTIRWLRSLNIMLGGLAGVSIAALGVDELRSRLRTGVLDASPEAGSARVEYLLYSGSMLGVFGTTFVGVSKLNTARTLMPALLFFAPFVVLTIRRGSGIVASRLEVDAIRRVGKIAVLAFVLAYFVLNVGLYGSATNEYHPNILIDKGRVIDDGSLAEKTYFWAMHYDTIYDLRATEWLEGRGADDGTYYRYGSKRVISGMYNCTGVSREPVVRQGTCDDRPARAVTEMNKVYSTSGSQIFYNTSDPNSLYELEGR